MPTVQLLEKVHNFPTFGYDYDKAKTCML